MTGKQQQLLAGFHHLTGPWWSSPEGQTWKLDGETLRRASHGEVGTLCAFLAHEQIVQRRDGIYCPGCEDCK